MGYLPQYTCNVFCINRLSPFLVEFEKRSILKDLSNGEYAAEVIFVDRISMPLKSLLTFDMSQNLVYCSRLNHGTKDELLQSDEPEAVFQICKAQSLRIPVLHANQQLVASAKTVRCV